MASKHNATQQQVSLIGKPAAPAKAEQPATNNRPAFKAPRVERKPLSPEEAQALFLAEMEKTPTATPVEAVLLLVDEATRLTAQVLADKSGKRSDLYLLTQLTNNFLPALRRLGAVDAVAKFSRLAKAIQTTPGQASNVAQQVVDPNFTPAPVSGKMVGGSEAIANDNGTRSIYQRLDCSTSVVAVAKSIGQCGGYADAFEFTSAVAAAEGSGERRVGEEC